jgi:hypothetical protein
MYNPEMLMFSDESGSDRRNYIRHYSYSVRGKPLISHKRGVRVNFIAFLSVFGMLDCKTVKHTVDGNPFCAISACCYLIWCPSMATIHTA